ncbi:MAG: HEAT repeat domain-containing protein, partial [Verrucomicrobiota bacterium]
IWQAINDLAKPWADSVLNGQWRIKGNERQLEYALNALSPAAAAPVLAFVLREKPLARDGNGPWIELIGKAGGPVELRKLLDVVLGDQLDPKPRERALAALIAAARERNVRPEGHLGRVTDFLQNENSQLRGAGARLAGLWKIEGTAPRLTELSDGDDRSVRAAALEGLRDMTGPAALDGLLHLADEGKSPAVRRAALVALAPVNLDAALARFPKVLADPASDTEMLELWRGILRVDGAAAALEKAFPPKLSPAALAAGLKAARETGYKGALLAKVIEPLAGRITLSPQEMANAISGMVFQVKVGSDPSLGELVYRRIGCAQCHAIGGAGGKLGPDFTSLGASAPVDYIIESVLDPAAKVKEGYHAFAFVMKDGSQLTGIPARETGAEQFIRPGPGAEVPLVKTNIVSRENVGSIMPAGLVDMLDFTEKRALFAFLGELGKPGVFDASKGNVARVWWLYADAAQAFQAANPEQNLPVHSLVDGRLVRELLAPLAATVSQGDLYAASRFEMAAGEEKPFVLLGAKSAWIDGEAVAIDAKGQLTGRIPAGPHVLAIRLDARQLPEAIKAQCDAARFLGE